MSGINVLLKSKLMSVRRLAPPELQPKEFAFTAANLDWAKREITKYPEGRQASAVIALLWRAQEQNGGWLPQKAIEYVAEMLGMAMIRVLEVATFYTMFLLEPVGGKAHVQVCGTTPCLLRGGGGDQEGLRAAHRPRPVPRVRRRRLLLGGGRVPRRLRQRADGADRQRHLRGSDPGDLREGARRHRPRREAEARARRSTANTRRRSAATPRFSMCLTRLRTSPSRARPSRCFRTRIASSPTSTASTTGGSRARGRAAPGTAPRRSSKRAATGSSTR